MHLQINFDFNSHFRVPTIKIGIDNTVLFSGNVLDTFSCEVPDINGIHTLWVKHYGKQPHETDQLNDTHVLIKNILFNDIDLDQIEYCKLTHRGQFYPEYNLDYVKDSIINKVELPEFISPNHYLGHNGVWKLEFRMPAMLWIIKEQNPSGINLEDTVFSSSTQSMQQIKDLFNL